MADEPRIFQCPACGGPVAYGAVACPRCGYRPYAPVTSGLNTSALALVLGALLIGGGSFLPWVTVNSIISIGRSGIDGGGDGVFTLVIGAVLLLLAIARINSVGLGLLARSVALVGGLAAIAIGVYDGANLANRLTELSSNFVSGSVGAGIFVVVIGGGVALVAALIG